MSISDAFAPLVKLFSDRAFVTALISAVVAVFVSFIPQLAQYQAQIVSLAVGLVLIAAGSTAAQSVVSSSSSAKIKVLEAQTALAVAQAQAAAAQVAHG